MLEKFREGSQGPGAKIILGAVIVTFALAGVSSYLGSGSVQSAAVVNGVDISTQSLETQVRNDRARLEQQQGEAFAARWEEPAFQAQIRQQSLNTLVAQNLLKQMSTELGLRIGDDSIRNYIFSMSEFQTDGEFNEDRYVSLLRQNGMTPAMFVERLRGDFAQQQLTNALINSDFSLPSEVTLLAELQGQQRQLSQLTIPQSAFSQDISIDDAAIAAYYDEHKESFVNPQQVSVDYILLDMADVSKNISLEANAAKAFYDEHITDYTQEDKLKVAHILIAFGDDESGAENRAEGLLAQIQAGEDFAKVAKLSSDDTFSGENGGELDWLEKGIMDPAFEAAAYELTNIGDVTSTLVKSEFGFHIIKLIDVQKGKTKSFDEVKDRIAQRLKSDQGTVEFDSLAETLAVQAYEMPDSLDSAAEMSGLAVTSTELFSARNVPAVLNDPKVMSLIFDEDFIAEGANSEMVNISDDLSIVLRVNESQPQSIKALDDVKTQIAERLATNEAISKSRAFAAELTAKLEANESVDTDLAQLDIKFTDAQWLNRYDYTKADYKVLSKLFTMAKPANDKATISTETTLGGDVAILKLEGVKSVPVSDQELAGLNGSLQNMNVQAAYNMLVQTLISTSDVKYPQPAE